MPENLPAVAGNRRVGKEEGEPVGKGRDIVRHPVEDHRLPGRLLQGRAFIRQQRREHVAHAFHVHQIGSVGIHKLPEGGQLRAQAHDAGQIALHLPGQGGAESFRGGLHRGHHGRGDHGHGGGAGVPAPRILRHIGFRHGHGDLFGRQGRILREGFHPRVVIQAGAADHLLAQHGVIRDAGQIRANVQAVHQAAVESDDIQLPSVQAVRQAGAQLGKGQAVVRKVLVGAQAENGPAAVIPEDQDHPLRGGGGKTPAQEAAQGGRVAHAAPSGVLHQLRLRGAQTVVLHAAVRYAVALPLRGAARGEENRDPAGASDPGGDHLPDVVGGLAVLGFQIRTAEVDQDRQIILLRERARKPAGRRREGGQKREKQRKKSFQNGILHYPEISGDGKNQATGTKVDRTSSNRSTYSSVMG